MMWVCRPGKHSILYNSVLDTKTIFIGWDGYNYDLHEYNTMTDFKRIVIQEKQPDARTSISNWAGQLYSFCCRMKKGDYVLIPAERSKFYTLAIITSDYYFDSNYKYPHRRKIDIVKETVEKESLCQSTQYSLGAFRTVFVVKQEEEVLNCCQ